MRKCPLKSFEMIVNCGGWALVKSSILHIFVLRIFFQTLQNFEVGA